MLLYIAERYIRLAWKDPKSSLSVDHISICNMDSVQFEVQYLKLHPFSGSLEICILAIAITP